MTRALLWYEKMEKEEFLAQLGNRIRKLRHIRGFTQCELASRCGYTSTASNSTINKIESGKSDVPASKLVKMADVLGVSVAFLLGEDDQNDEEKYFAKNNAMMLMKKKLSKSEQEELIKGLEIYFSEAANSNAGQQIKA